jgi:hypothetical protein
LRQAQDSQIAARVPARQLCRELASVWQPYRDIVVAFHDVVGSQDQVGGICNAAGGHSPPATDQHRCRPGLLHRSSH